MTHAEVALPHDRNYRSLPNCRNLIRLKFRTRKEWILSAPPAETLMEGNKAMMLKRFSESCGGATAVACRPQTGSRQDRNPRLAPAFYGVNLSCSAKPLNQFASFCQNTPSPE
jgi:hypothetical protein